MFACEVTAIKALKSGDNSAFAWLLDQYGGLIMGTARRYLRSEDAAAECTQDVIVTVFEKISSFKNDGSFEGWIRRITVNRSLSELRKTATRKTDNFDDILPQFDDTGHRIEDKFMCHAPSQEEIYMRTQDVSLLHDAINTLPDDYRAIIMLRDIEEYTTAECAKVLEISEQNVKTRLHRARAALRHYFLSLGTSQSGGNNV